MLFIKPFTIRKIPYPLFFKFNKVYFAEAKKKNFYELKDDYIINKKKRDQTQSLDNEHLDKVLTNVFRINSVVRFPIYLPILPLIWMHPLASSYSLIMYSEIFYIISLMTIEGASIFALGLYNYKTVMIKEEDESNKETIEMHNRFNRKRILMPIFFFVLMMISLNQLNNNNISGSLYTLLFTNIYLYYKMASQITLMLCPEALFYNSMNCLGVNFTLIIILILIYKSKNKLIQNSLLF